ncbi:hypothetical protein OPIT5_06720 [Opitutaceae bacterium TAV5]|nr:hypothetical protein OPIT5_06720 [Opitutaceae bacterium TAV5]
MHRRTFRGPPVFLRVLQDAPVKSGTGKRRIPETGIFHPIA